MSILSGNPPLKLGMAQTPASRAEVTRLQTLLTAAGFSPGALDGDFGPGTQAAVIAFQRSSGLLADGVVGPRTAAALAENPHPAPLADATAGMTVAIAARLFPHTLLANIKKNLPIVLDALRLAGIADRVMVLTALATIRAESEGFEPISEGLSRYNTSPGGHPFDLYDHRRDLGNRGAPDGREYCGRGFIQLTGRDNYKKYGPRLTPQQDLVHAPALANQPLCAAQILALFLKDQERNIKEAMLNNDYARARRCVNGGSHGLDRFTSAYQIGDDLLA